MPHYFPDDKSYTRRAKQSLALLYLQEYDYRRAMELFDEFAGYNDAEVQFKAFGLAGQAIVLNRQKQLRRIGREAGAALAAARQARGRDALPDRNHAQPESPRAR